MKNTFTPNPSSPTYRMLVFWIGIAATIAYRSIIILGHYSQTSMDIAWYIGTVGFIWYFAHRFHVEEKRDRLIMKTKLINKVAKLKELKNEDREALEYTLKSLISSKSRWNYIAIFIASGLALIYDIIIRILLK